MMGAKVFEESQERLVRLEAREGRWDQWARQGQQASEERLGSQFPVSRERREHLVREGRWDHRAQQEQQELPEEWVQQE